MRTGRFSQRITVVRRNVSREERCNDADTGIAHYWSRSQPAVEKAKNRPPAKCTDSYWIAMAMCVLLVVDQDGGITCRHTGRESCFYRKLDDGDWQTVDPVLKRPGQHPRQHWGTDRTRHKKNRVARPRHGHARPP